MGIKKEKVFFMPVLTKEKLQVQKVLRKRSQRKLQRSQQKCLKKEEVPNENPVKSTDPGYCGLDPLTTGPNDPYYESGACPSHDKEFENLIDGKPHDDSLYVNGKFAVDCVRTAAVSVVKAIYAVVTLPVYITIGTLGGFLRWAQVHPKPKSDPIEKREPWE